MLRVFESGGRVFAAGHMPDEQEAEAGNSIVQRALTNRWLHEQGVPDRVAAKPAGATDMRTL